MLQNTFAYTGFEELKEIPFTVMKHLQVVPSNFLKQLASDPRLYQNCPLEIKRQIWQSEETLFRQQIFPIVSVFLKKDDKVDSLFHEMEVKIDPKQIRDNTESLQKIAELLGDNLTLYNIFLHLLRTLYNETGNPHFCDLRASILMTLHDKDVKNVCSIFSNSF